jgi:pimeloyl-ACP methyl ester carboxylesterase
MIPEAKVPAFSETMRMVRLTSISVLVGATCLFASAVASAQVGEGIVVFNDGFQIAGKVLQDRKTEHDESSGMFYSISSGSIYMDDAAHRICFSPGQVKQTIKLTAGDLDKDHQKLAYDMVKPPGAIPYNAWQFKSLPAFDKKWEREVQVTVSDKGGTRVATFHQRVIMLTPRFMFVQSLDRNWDMWFGTKELGADVVSKLVTDFYDQRKMFKDQTGEEKEFMLARFLQQAGYLDSAQKHVDSLLVTSKDAEHKKLIGGLGDIIADEKAKIFTDELEALAQGKQHTRVLEKLRDYDRLGLIKNVPQKTQLFITDLKNRYEADAAKLAKMRTLFKYMMSRGPMPRGYWLNCLATIDDELNYDTIERLDTFGVFAEQHKRQIEQGSKPAQSVEQVLALAVTGWHLGNIAAEPDVKLAQKMWKTRDFFSQYMRLDTAAARAAAVASWEKEAGFPIDVVARLLQHLPPPNAYKKLTTTEPIDLDIDLPENAEGAYRIQLPPDYHHGRPHPVLVLMHGRELPELLVRRWTDLAAQNGFILMAPRWIRPTSPKPWGFTPQEHYFVENCIKDMKRRFNIDSDRVFMYGWDMGGEIAWDFGLGHPDLFAGVLPMCGTPRLFSAKCWTNAQYLPLYIVDGDKSGPGPMGTREMMKDFIRCNFPAFYFEHKGRASELYTADFEPMMRWMSAKRRVFPTKALGTYNPTGYGSEEFRSLRQSDTHFYWLSSDEIQDEHTQDYTKWDKTRSPAKFQGSVVVQNESDAKGNARIVTQISLRILGLKNVTVWLSPALVDFTKPIQLRVNGQSVGLPKLVTPTLTTMLEEHFKNVDRQRLFYAKIDYKP